MHETFAEDRTCSSEDMIADRQTHTRTDTYDHHNTPLLYRGRSKNSDNFYSGAIGLALDLRSSVTDHFTRDIKVVGKTVESNLSRIVCLLLKMFLLYNMSIFLTSIRGRTHPRRTEGGRQPAANSPAATPIY